MVCSVSKCKLSKRLNMVAGSFERDAPRPDWEKQNKKNKTQPNHGEYQQKSNFS